MGTSGRTILIVVAALLGVFAFVWPVVTDSPGLYFTALAMVLVVVAQLASLLRR